MRDTSTTVSVILAAEGPAHDVAQAIASVVAQSYSDWELIVVDDGQNRDVASTIAALSGRRIRHLRHDMPTRAAGRNFGTDVAGGGYVCFLDGTDRLLPEFFSTAIHFLDSFPDVGLATPGHHIIDADGTIRHTVRSWEGTNQLKLWDLLTRGCPAEASGLFMRREWLDRVGGFDAALSEAEDWDILLRLSEAGCQIAWIENVLLCRRADPELPRETLVSIRDGKVDVMGRFFGNAASSAHFLPDQTEVHARLLQESALTAFQHGAVTLGRDDLAAAIQRDPALVRNDGAAIVEAVRAHISRYEPPDPRAFLDRMIHNLPESAASARRRLASLAAADSASPISVSRRWTPSGQFAAASRGTHCVTGAAPTVSIVLPTYNRSAYIGPAIRSALEQSFDDLELIVIDDGSTDDTPDIVQQCSDRRLIYIRQNNQKAAGARNTGLRNARGRYISFLDSDDLLLPRAIADEVEFLDDQPTVGLVHGGCTVIDTDGHHQFDRTPWTWGQQLSLVDLLLKGNPMGASGMMIRRPWLEKVRFFDVGAPPNEDTDLLLRLAAAGCPMAWLERLVASYRMHGGNVIQDPAPMSEGHRRLYHCFFQLRHLPTEIQRHKDEVFLRIHLESAFRAYQAGAIDLAHTELRRAVSLHPELLNRHDSAFVTKALGHTLYFHVDPVPFLEFVKQHLPPELRALRLKLGLLQLSLTTEQRATTASLAV